MRQKILILFISSLLSLYSLAQNAHYSYKFNEYSRPGLSPLKKIAQYQCDVWQKDKGLPQNSVFAITQNTDGYLWIGTYEGVARFDGLEFTIYNTGNVDQLHNNSIWDVYEDSEKRIWLGTNNGGLTCYSKGKFKTYKLENGLPSNIINKITEDANHNLWVGTRQGLCLFKNNAFKVYSTKDGLASRDITELYVDKKKRLWIGTTRGLNVYNKGKFEDYSRNKILFINKNITSICEDNQGGVWIGTQMGLVRWNEAKNEYTTFRVEDGLTDDYITKVYLDSRGTLWIGTQGGGLNRVLERYQNKKNPVFESFTVKEGLTANSVTTLFEDKEGSLWIGLNRGGLNRLKDVKFTNYTTTEGLTDNITNCIYEDKSGGIWVGTVSGGVSYLKEGKFTSYTKNDGLSNNYIRSVLEDQQGDIWLGTYGGGVNQLVFNKAKTKIRRINTYLSKDGLVGNIVRALYQSSDGAMWIGTKTGLSKYYKGKFQNYNRQLGLSNSSVMCIYEDQRQNIWVGTDGGGVNCIRPDNTIISYTTHEGLINDLVFCIYEDYSGSIWVGTDGGISRIKEGHIANIGVKDGLPSEAIHSILEDDYQKIWMSCNSGVFCVNKAELDQCVNGKTEKVHSILYEEEDGMKSSDCAAFSQPSSMKDKHGNLWLPTTTGITMIHPRNIKINQHRPPVVIERFVADNKEYSVYEKLSFKAGTSRFEIDFASLSFLAPRKIEYRYKLEGAGYSEGWTNSRSKRNVYYTNLPPGTYKFVVHASNNDGIWNDVGASVEFYVKPFFYQTIWFYALTVFTVFALGFAIYYWRIRSLERAKKNLEKGIEQSTQKIRNQYQEIRQQTEELETINHIVRTINQEVKFEKVLQALLKQGLLLFSQSNKAIFLLYLPQQDVFRLVAAYGYEEDEITLKEFKPKKVLEYCATGLSLEEGLYKLQPAINLQRLAPHYKPKSSLAMQISTNGTLEGVIFFDNSIGYQDVQNSDIQKLIRFKEHAVSAFYKARFLKEIELKNHQVETSFRKISDSIRYARRIQQAILPEEEEIQSYLEDSFIFYQPKDIVSGDFYWFNETSPNPIYGIEPTNGGKTSVFKGFEETKIVFAAIDCTGHGVPGAFMTMIGNNFLNTIILEEKVISADKILARLDKEVISYLKQDDRGQSRDGMDMALLVIDHQESTLEYAGAKNPLYFIRNGELQQIKASKYSIGGTKIKKRKSFDVTTIHYREGDIFYMCSDGFQDQFGGEHDRKYGSKRLRQFLLSIHHLPMPAQKQKLKEEIENWRDGQNQTDDILVTGIKF